jgi:hypothetical protein
MVELLWRLDVAHLASFTSQNSKSSGRLSRLVVRRVKVRNWFGTLANLFDILPNIFHGLQINKL